MTLLVCPQMLVGGGMKIMHEYVVPQHVYVPHIFTLTSALESGKQITNGYQWISYSTHRNEGYLTCDTPGCCDTVFISLYDTLLYIGLNGEDWNVVDQETDLQS